MTSDTGHSETSSRLSWRHAPALLLLAAAGFGCAPARAAPGCGLPADTGDGMRLAATAERPFTPDAFCASLARIATSEANLHGVVVERGGKLLVEAYFEGPDHPGASFFAKHASFGPDDLHDVRSVTKSVTALLLGIARDHGAITDLDAPVLAHFPEYADLQATPAARVTLAHLLGMASGLAWDESGGYLRPGNDETRMRFATDPLRQVLERDRVAEPGTHFNYNGGGTALLGEVVARATGMPLEAWAEERLFGPLDIRRTEWRRDRRGQVTPFGGLRLRPRDMVKLGRLVLNRGAWNGRQVVSGAWVDEMVRDRLPAGALRYGWQWWRGTIGPAENRHAYIAAFGNGGQRVFVLPTLDLVVVVTAGQYNQETSWRAPLRVLQQVVSMLPP